MLRFAGRLWMLAVPVFVLLLSAPAPLHAMEAGALIDLTQHPVGYLSLLIFFVAYGFVAVEEVIQLRKSKPIMLAAGLIWALLGAVYAAHDQSAALEAAAKHVILDYGELMLFLVVAITYVNTMQERRVFAVVRAKLTSKKLSYRQLFWLVGGIAFFGCPMIDNLTTALVMGAVVVAVGVGNYQFIVMGCIIIVVAANAGGVYSQFGDVTSLMVWQKGKLEFLEFFHLFLPALVNFLVPATLMHFGVPKGMPEPVSETRQLKHGAAVVIGLFAATIATAVAFKSIFSLPPALGMMLGLGYLQMYSYILQRIGRRRDDQDMAFDSLREIRRLEWDTLLFFFGVIFARRTWRRRLSRACVEFSLWRPGTDRCQHRDRCAGRGVRQHPADVRGAHHEPGYVERPVDARHAEHRCRGEPRVHRHGGGRGADGTAAQPLHVYQPSSMDLGHCARLRGKHPDPSVDQRRAHVAWRSVEHLLLVTCGPIASET